MTDSGRKGAPPVVLLHGWPGNRHDYRQVVPLLSDAADIIVPDLRGFGGSDKHAVAVRHFYSATAQAGSVIGLIKELGVSGSCSPATTSAAAWLRVWPGCNLIWFRRLCSLRRCPAPATAC